MKEFITAADAVVNDIQWIEFKYDGTLCRAVKQPSDGQIAFMMANTSSRIPDGEKIGALLNFFDSTLDDETHAYVSRRLLDPKDKFGVEEIQDILEWLMEEWTGRPTQPSSGSIPPPPTAGLTSTPPTPAPIY